MTRVKRGVVTKKRHKKILKSVKGSRGVKSRNIKRAIEARMKAGQHAYRDRRKKKRDIRALWISRLNAALSAQDVKYKDFIHNMTIKNIKLDRKILAQIALENPETFKAIVEEVK